MPRAAAAPRPLPKPRRTPAETRQIISRLGTQHPNADTELHFTNAYELLVATILSAQTTDERVNQVTPALFKRYPDVRRLAEATTDELEPQIQSTGFFRAKSRALLGMATQVVARFGGEIPHTMDDLVTLPGVGRKTANVVLGHALGVPGLPVDRHVLRVANRIGIARSDDPEVVEQQLCAAIPLSEWTRTSDTLILHGRRICKPRPLCDRCVVRDACVFYLSLRSTSIGLGRAAKPARGAAPSRARDRAPNTRNAGRDEGPSAGPAGRGSLRVARRVPKTRVTGREGGPAAERVESGSLAAGRRATKARDTGRGGGAPRQIKK